MEKLVEKYGFVFCFAHINKRFFCTRFSTRFSCVYDIHTRSYDYSTRSYDIIIHSYTFLCLRDLVILDGLL